MQINERRGARRETEHLERVALRIGAAALSRGIDDHRRLRDGTDRPGSAGVERECALMSALFGTDLHQSRNDDRGRNSEHEERQLQLVEDMASLAPASPFHALPFRT